MKRLSIGYLVPFVALGIFCLWLGISRGLVSEGVVYFALGLVLLYVSVLLFHLDQSQEKHQENLNHKEKEIKALQESLNQLQEEYQELLAHKEKEIKALQESLNRLQEEEYSIPRIRSLDDAKTKTATVSSPQSIQENKKTLPRLNSEQLYILQRLFINEYRIRVRSLDGGFSNLGVFQVVPETMGGSLRSGFVVKFLTNRDILKEQRVHGDNGFLKKYPLNFTPGKPVRHWPDDIDDSEKLGALVYQFTVLENDSQLQTLKSLYNEQSSEEIIGHLNRLFNKLNDWYGQRFPLTGNTSLELRGAYNRLDRRRRDIREGICQLLEPSGNTEGNFDEQEKIKLCFLSKNWEANDFCNPMYWIKHMFLSGEAQCLNTMSAYSPVHGDLHTGNVLIEIGKVNHIWLIDFPNAIVGPSVQDFATLEADIKFSLIDMEKCSLEAWLNFEEMLLSPLKKSDYHTLISPFQEGHQPENSELRKAWELVKFLRIWVKSHGLIGADIRAYYLALLHSTLPIVYRDAYTTTQKQCALTSSAWLCEYLT